MTRAELGEAAAEEWLRERLSAAYESHAAGGCRGRIVFAVEQGGAMFGEDGGSQTLVGRCSTCGTLQIIA